MKAVIFDAFGTLIGIGHKQNPYGRAGADRDVMTKPVALRDLTSDSTILAAFELEKLSMFVYPEAYSVLHAFRHAGFKIAIGSNLALDYGTIVKSLFMKHVDHLHLSYEVGALKPDPEFFVTCCDQIGCLPEDTVMIGDSYRSDFIGAAEAGLNAQLLNRDYDDLWAHFDLISGSAPSR